MKNITKLSIRSESVTDVAVQSHQYQNRLYPRKTPQAYRTAKVSMYRNPIRDGALYVNVRV